MQIEDLIKLIRARKINGISCNSKAVKKGSLFVAVKGAKEDGSRFIDQAISRGAKIIVYGLGLRKNIKRGVSLVKVKDTRLAIAQLSSEFYGNPSEQLKIIGVTGTNGKTTITYILEAILKEAGSKVAVIGTVNYRFKDIILPARNTTPGPLELQSMMASMVKERIDYCAIEVSSHALEQGRVLGINFQSAIFTNLAQDHLDYHKTIGSYFLAKTKLFKGLSPRSFAVLNYDDKYFSSLKKLTKAKVITYGLSVKSQVRAVNIKYGLSSTEFLLFFPKGEMEIKTRLIGKHNLYNLLAAFSWAYQEDIDLKDIKTALEKFSFVPGRLERIECKKGFYVFVDYAHTEDALKNILLFLRGLSPRKIITVFGCGGERDKLKRPKMGRVATELSDFVVITDDNPRSEKSENIISDIKKGTKKDNYSVFPARKAAIKNAISMAVKGDIVVIAGKGHEDYQVLGDGVIHFDDREEVRLCLKSLNY